MTRPAFLIVLLLMIIASTAASAGEIKGAGAGSCGQWVEERKNNNNWSSQLHWVQGYISAYNVYVYRGKHPNGVFGNADHNALAVWLDNYCEKNPLSSPASGMSGLISELNRRQ